MVAFDFWNLEGKAPPVPFDAGPIGPARALRFGHERENGSSIRMAPGRGVARTGDALWTTWRACALVCQS